MSKANDGHESVDEGTAQDASAASKPEQTGVPADQVSSLVSEFRQSIEAMRKAAPAPAPVAKPRPSADEVKERIKIASERANELAAEGKYAESMLHMYQQISEAQASQASDVQETPAFKALKATAERTAKSDHADAFAKYGAEIKAHMADRPAEEQINPDAWDRAVREVKLNHFDEILEAERVARAKAIEDADTGGPDVNVAGGSRGRRQPTKGDAAELSAAEVDFARRINFTPEKYAAAKKRYTEHARTDGVFVLDEAEGAPVAPGKF